eukprot:COSAG01_NODE_13465_length_1582_cov_2.670263_2_plen_352_part_00
MDLGQFLTSANLTRNGEGLAGIGCTVVSDLHDLTDEECESAGMKPLEIKRMRRKLGELSEAPGGAGGKAPVGPVRELIVPDYGVINALPASQDDGDPISGFADMTAAGNRQRQKRLAAAGASLALILLVAAGVAVAVVIGGNHDPVIGGGQWHQPCTDNMCGHGSCVAATQQPQSRTCECDAGWSGTGCDIAAPSWVLGGATQTCGKVCSDVGLQCNDGDWGVHDAPSFRTALAAAGYPNSDTVCPGGVPADGGDAGDYAPFIWTYPVPVRTCHFATGLSRCASSLSRPSHYPDPRLCLCDHMSSDPGSTSNCCSLYCATHRSNGDCAVCAVCDCTGCGSPYPGGSCDSSC